MTGRVHRAGTALVAVAGVGLRLEQLLANRSLWLDETLLVTNIVQRDYLELLEPLDGDQGAPVLFLWLERTAVLIGGNNELALRVFPFVAGIALLPVVYLLGRRLVSPAAGTIAMALVAFAPALVRYSTEVKQYSTDALMCALAVLLAVMWLDRQDGRRLVALAVVGAVGVWLSHPLTLVLAGIGILLAGHAATRRDGPAVVRLAVTGAAWAASVGVSYLVTLRDLRANEVLSSYWRVGFPPGGSSLVDRLTWMPEALGDFAADPGRLRAAAAAGVVAVVGAWCIARRSGSIRLAVVVSPVAVALAAAAARAYPLSGRIALYLVPVAALLAAAAVARRPFALVGVPLLILVTSPWWREVGRITVDPFEVAESRPVLAYVSDHRQPGDRVYIHGPAIGPYSYYGPIVGLTADERTAWFDEATCSDLPPPYEPLADSAGPAERVWVVFAYTFSGRPDDEAELVRQQFDVLGDRLDLFSAHDAFAALYLVRRVNDGGGPRPGVPSRDSPPELACLGARPIAPLR